MNHTQTTKHTPGPWIAARTPKHGGPFITSSSGKLTIVNSVNGMSTEEREANARLIAAAPELAEALQELVELMPGLIRQLPLGVPMSVSNSHDKARQVLASAGVLS